MSNNWTTNRKAFDKSIRPLDSAGRFPGEKVSQFHIHTFAFLSVRGKGNWMNSSAQGPFASRAVRRSARVNPVRSECENRRYVANIF